LPLKKKNNFQHGHRSAPIQPTLSNPLKALHHYGYDVKVSPPPSSPEGKYLISFKPGTDKTIIDKHVANIAAAGSLIRFEQPLIFPL